MTLDQSAKIYEIETWDDYLSLNNTLGNPLLFRLTTRGLYSEVNCLLLAIMYCLIKRRRIIVDQSQFGGIKWNSLFSTSLPSYASSDELRVSELDELSLHKIIKFFSRRHSLSIPLFTWWDSQFRSVFMLKSHLARLLHSPSFSTSDIIDFTSNQFLSIQIRRGDKISGYMHNNKLIIEGDDVGLDSYQAAIEKFSRGIKLVFVISDSYAHFRKIERLMPEYNFFTLCEKNSAGYDNTSFQASSLEVRTNALRSLISSVNMCGKSNFFVGPFTSNPSRMVPLLQGTLSNSVSVDRARRWRAN